MVRHSDVLSPFRAYPHVDMKEAGARAMALLMARIARGAPFAKAFRQLDFLIPLTSQCTLVAPMSEVMAARQTIAARLGASELALCFGFPYADFADCGCALVAYGVTQDAADAAADALLRELKLREVDFAQPILPADQAVAEAMRLAGTGAPVLIADTQDNPGGGGHGDTTGLLKELIAQRAEGAVLGLINDAESAAACHAAGEGATVSLSLGGKSDGAPLAVDARVLKVTDGRFLCTGPMVGGNWSDLGPSALIGIGGVAVIVTSRKTQAYDQALFRHVGIEPSRQRILALKSSVHFRADFQPISSAVVIAAAPGPVVADPAVLPFRHLRPGLRLRPGDNRRTG
jgi:microcystin degradation protein MlrC